MFGNEHAVRMPPAAHGGGEGAAHRRFSQRRAARRRGPTVISIHSNRSIHRMHCHVTMPLKRQSHAAPTFINTHEARMRPAGGTSGQRPPRGPGGPPLGVGAPPCAPRTTVATASRTPAQRPPASRTCRGRPAPRGEGPRVCGPACTLNAAALLAYQLPNNLFFDHINHTKISFVAL